MNRFDSKNYYGILLFQLKIPAWLLSYYNFLASPNYLKSEEGGLSILANSIDFEKANSPKPAFILSFQIDFFI